jgi:predicted hydrocarbon binding protein
MTTLSPTTLTIFGETLVAETGQDTLQMILTKANLDPALSNPVTLLRLSGPAIAEAYANIQSALRAYYGRGARGTLLRIGRLMWGRLMDRASLPEKTRMGAIRLLPMHLRAKPALEGLITLLRQPTNEMSIHSLDMELIFVENSCATCEGQTSTAPFCFVTIGLIQECLYWTTGKEFDVEETNCKAAGEPACKFKIITS